MKIPPEGCSTFRFFYKLPLMVTEAKRRKSRPVSCPYLPDREFTQEYFFSTECSLDEFQTLLDEGWRRFGTFFFRPVCDGCRECRPIRVPVASFSATKSQRRNLHKNTDLTVYLREQRDYIRSVNGSLASPLPFLEAYELYKLHGKSKFDQEKETVEQFSRSFYQPVPPAFVTEYRDCNGRLAGVGYLDSGTKALSSVYFAYHPDFADRGLGTCSALREIRLAGEMGLEYYYLGYFIADCPRMSYKARFRPFELMDWDSGEWATLEE